MKKALSLNLTEDFLALLKEEIDRRGIKLED
ncbi:sporulation histidine kinase inhibitor Sda [Anaerobacillus sp. HL2]|nr:sporulation histidine kinase inhibitor Sda [Anaerobacillus sp. HL2]